MNGAPQLGGGDRGPRADERQVVVGTRRGGQRADGLRRSFGLCQREDDAAVGRHPGRGRVIGEHPLHARLGFAGAAPAAGIARVPTSQRRPSSVEPA